MESHILVRVYWLVNRFYLAREITMATALQVHNFRILVSMGADSIFIASFLPR